MALSSRLTPQQRRAALEQLSRDRLTSLSDHFGLDVGDRRVIQNHVNAIVRSQSVDFGVLLGLLKREELQAICGALGLAQAGREKEVLVQRILGGSGESDSSSGKSQKNGNGAAAQMAPDLPATGKLTVDQLERYLWSAADILRGSIDSSDYKNFIFGLLFLKRISDVFEEEAEKLIADGHPPEVAWEDKDEHQFFVPKSARWSEIQKVATNIGEALNKACAKLEEQNSALDGILAGIDFNDERKLGDTKNRDTVLSRLVQHFSKVSLRNSSLAEPDMLGRAYEYLIEKFADDAGKKGGEFYTPKKVVELIVELLRPTEDMRICDPTCGSGGMMIECANYVKRHGGSSRKLSLHGQEKNLGTWAIAKMNMLLHGLSDHRIEKGDTIRSPKLIDASGLLLYDRVIANPPFSLDEWGVEVAEADAHGRFRFGVPPKTKGDLAFVQHMISILNGERGQLGVVMPHGVLFRGGSEAEIRKGFLTEDLIEAVIGLPSNLFYGTGIPAAVLIINRAKPADRRGKVLVINASAEFQEGKAQNYLRDQDVKKIAATFHAFKDVEGYARMVSVEEIERNDFTLNISRYVDTAEEVATVDVAEAVRKLRQLEVERAAAEAKMNAFLKDLGYAE
ncbi:type I restriction endonuclease subunit M [Corallococcus sp. CA041A]|uniref:HsdM family class I SAM-dependent methyltransferase n=1 Tax=Corallococcus sp. CA041A TaxID=2316727 RepID=UPI000EA2D70D|nr:class I SAM-dependent DNA methyltransferase [Corallococcus sp. CA041A]RKH29781.1 type I restriction endonuclease subunit M [Corallococcus sp. CA041A]